MSEQFNNDILCGAIFENGEYAPIYCNRITGECYFPDPVMSYNRLIAEVSADDPVEVSLEEIVAAMEDLAYGKCIGVIYNGESILKIIDDETAIEVPVDSPLRTGVTFAIDIYGDYDED